MITGMYAVLLAPTATYFFFISLLCVVFGASLCFQARFAYNIQSSENSKLICASQKSTIFLTEKNHEMFFNSTKTTRVRRYQNTTVLNFIGAKDDGDGGDNWSYKTCKSNRHHQQNNTQIFKPGMPFLSPTQLYKSTEGRFFHWVNRYHKAPVMYSFFYACMKFYKYTLIFVVCFILQRHLSPPVVCINNLKLYNKLTQVIWLPACRRFCW